MIGIKEEGRGDLEEAWQEAEDRKNSAVMCTDERRQCASVEIVETEKRASRKGDTDKPEGESRGPI